MGNGIYRPIPFTCARVVSFHLNWGRCCVWWNSFIFELMMIFVLPVRGVCTVHYTSCNHSPHRHSASTTRPSPTLYFFCLLHFCYGLFFSVPENWQNSSPENSITAEGGKLCRFLVVFFFNFDTDAARSFEQHTLLLRSLWHYFIIAKFPFEFLISARSFDKHAFCSTL